MKQEAPVTKNRKARAIRNKNPFALIQTKPEQWQGLVGSEPDGFLIFSNPVFGVRAGYINLVNGYIRKGLNTLSKIFPVYAPITAGNNPNKYTELVSKITGIDPNRPLEAADIYAIGRAIERIEAGQYWVDAEDWDQGWTLSIPRIKSGFLLSEINSGLQKFKKATQKATAVAGSVPL
jgi:hypothetical protein